MSQKRKASNRKTSSSMKRQQQKDRKKKQVWQWVGIGFVVVIVAIAIILLIPKSTTATEISAAQAYEKFSEGAFFLDIRSKDEWDQAHIANSINIPLDELQDHLSELPSNQDIVVVCLVGKRSQEGMTTLRNAGFSRATCMTGGLKAWQAAGYPLESSSP